MERIIFVQCTIYIEIQKISSAIKRSIWELGNTSIITLG
jgi:hypothetical protein